MTFLKLTKQNGKLFFLNFRHIVEFELTNNGTEIVLSTENVITVRQTPADIVREIDKLEFEIHHRRR